MIIAFMAFDFSLPPRAKVFISDARRARAKAGHGD